MEIADKFLPLGHYTKVGDNDYITYTKVGSKEIGASVTVNAKNSSNTIVNKTVDVHTTIAIEGDSIPYKCGTYTQLGIQDGRNLFKTDTTTERKPVMILVTDGDPTHYDERYTDVTSSCMW